MVFHYTQNEVPDEYMGDFLKIARMALEGWILFGFINFSFKEHDMRHIYIVLALAS